MLITFFDPVIPNSKAFKINRSQLGIKPLNLKVLLLCFQFLWGWVNSCRLVIVMSRNCDAKWNEIGLHCWWYGLVNALIINREITAEYSLENLKANGKAIGLFARCFPDSQTRCKWIKYSLLSLRLHNIFCCEMKMWFAWIVPTICC